MTLAYSLLAAIIVSFVSVLGLLFMFIGKKTIKHLTLFLVSFAVGGLLGDAIIHIIPESYESIGNDFLVSILVISGILLFFILEKILRWRHCHEINCHEEKKHGHITILNLVGDTVHNLVDGMIIASSFMVSFEVGLVTTLAVMLHEIPQEMGDVGIMLHQGFSLKKAIIFNLISASSALIGVLIIFLVGQSFQGLSDYIMPITAGGFIYLAASDLIPELHRHDTKISVSITQMLAILLGLTLMSVLLFLG